MNERIFNFSAGPSMLPVSVLEKAGKEILNYNGSGMSVMEMSHRSPAFLEIFNATKLALREAMQIPDEYEILFLQGGASTQFSAVPLNLMSVSGKADYAVTGNFSGIAAKEAKKYGTVNTAFDCGEGNYTFIPKQNELSLDPEASYFYYCANNTIFGTEWKYIPETGDVPIVCDMSSDILSRPVDVSKYGIIFAGAQKNMAPAGLTVVIIRKDLAGKHFPYTPLMLEYAKMIDKDSMYNTPPCWCIYILGLVLDWVKSMGGIPAMEKLKTKRASLLYDYLDESALFDPVARREDRSDMNVRMTTGDADLDLKFANAAGAAGFSNLKGHRLTGGIRASIYNAMPIEGITALIDFMKQFEKENR